jgi:class 3 adenylate cyclase/tetratricopeptide (TPR) repeat protein
MSEGSTLCPYCGTEWPAGLEMRFCGECGSKLGALSPEITGKERRTLTVLFADLSGFTSFSEGRDPETVEGVVDELLSELGEVVESYGGYVDKYLGDAVMAVFGAPEAHEDDPLRAVRTGLELCDVVGSFNDEHAESLSVSVGVNTGEVLWSQVGGGDYTVTGGAVNVAKRLEDTADPNAVLVSGGVGERVGDAVRCSRQEAVPVEGRESPVRAAVVESVAVDRGPDGDPSEKVGGETPLCGRDAELATLLDRYDASEPSFLAVTGPAGIGKSRLRRAFQRRVTGRSDPAVLEAGHCSQHADVPLEPFGDVLLSRADVGRGDPGAGRRVVAAVRDDLSGSGTAQSWRETAAHLLAASVGLDVPETGLPELPAGQMEAATRRAWRSWLRALAGDRPVVLGIEDLQWADDATRDLLAGLQEDATGDTAALAGPVTVVTTTRDAGAVPAGFETVALTPLAESDAPAVAEAVLDAPVGGELASFLHDQTGGNPYFLEELLRYLRATDLLETTADGYALAGRDAVEVPETLDGLLVGRIDALPPGARETVKGASVVGRRFWTGHLAATLDRDVDRPVGTLTDRGMVTPREESTLPDDEELAFEHDLLRDAAYGLLPESTRVELHGGVATELVDAVDGEGTVLASRIAHHCEQAEQYGRAVEWYRRAGDGAAETYAGEDAISHYERAITLAREHGVADDATVAGIYAAVGHVRQKRGAYESALEAVAQGTAAAPEKSREHCRLLGVEGDVNTELSNFEETRNSARKQRELAAEIGARDLEAKATKQLGLTAEYRGEYDRAREYYERALDVVGETDDPTREAGILDGLGVVAHRQGEYDRAQEYLGRALGITQDTGNRFSEKAILNDLGLVAMNRGEYDRAREYYEEALDIAREIGDRRGEAVVVHNLGEIAGDRGAYGRARERYERSLAIERELGNRHGEAISLRNLGDVAVELGEYDRARECYEQGLAIAEDLDSTDTTAECLHGLGALAREQGSPDAAGRYLDRALALREEIGDRRGAALTRLEAGRLALARDDVGAARECVERARETLEDVGASHAVAESQHLRGRVAARAGSTAEAREHWRAALEAFDGVGAPQDALATLERLVAACREQGDEQRAREWVRRARERLADAPAPAAEEHEAWVTREAGDKVDG